MIVFKIHVAEVFKQVSECLYMFKLQTLFAFHSIYYYYYLVKDGQLGGIMLVIYLDALGHEIKGYNEVGSGSMLTLSDQYKFKYKESNP
jgi:hypothetical protein